MRSSSFPRSSGRPSDRKSPKFGSKKPGKPRGNQREEFRDEKRARVKSSGPKMGAWQSSAYVPSFALKTISMPDVRPVGEAPRKPKAKLETPPQSVDTPVQIGEGKERLQKVLARSGVASRRKAELLILEGAVTVNGRPAVELGTKVDPTKDKIKVNGKLIHTDVEYIYLALYKPKGMISALADPEGRAHLGHIVSGVRERVVPIGRLNYNSEGLMLLTNDGDLAEKVLKTRGIPKVYMVKIKGHPTEEHLGTLKRGIFTADGVVRFAATNVEQSLRNKSWLKLEVTEGSQLDLRELLNQRGFLVDRIVRTAIGPVSIQGLEPGQYHFVKKSDFEAIMAMAEKLGA